MVDTPLKVSLVLLTMDRAQSVIYSLKSNLESAEYPIHEIIHVDNGSRDRTAIKWIDDQVGADVQVLHGGNYGVAKGYNRGMLLATGTHIVITGCDRIMPQGWLFSMAQAAQAIPETGVISCYSTPCAAFMLDQFASRYKSEPYTHNGVQIRQSLVAEARFHSRDFLFKAGLFREDFGLYGYEDVEWAERAERVARAYGLKNYVLPALGYAEHLSDQDGPAGYADFKVCHNGMEWKKALAARCWDLGNPYYNPYWRDEPDMSVGLQK